MIEFEGRQIPTAPGDTLASALFRAGVRIFSRSFRFRRPRGLLCMTGDCPNCLVKVNGEPCVHACTTPADNQRVERQRGWPAPDLDLGAWLGAVRASLPLGFRYKALGRPEPLARAAGSALRDLGGITELKPETLHRTDLEAEHHNVDVLVAGAGVAGLSAALAAATAGATVLIADERAVGTSVPPGATLDAINTLADAVRSHDRITLLERATVIGLYEGPFVPIATASRLHAVHPARIIVATGAAEQPPVFDGNDRVGVMLGRGAAILAGRHALLPGTRIVFAGEKRESLEHLATLRAAGANVVATLLPSELAAEAPADSAVLRNARIRRVNGPRIRSVEIDNAGATVRVECDAVVLSSMLAPRDNLLRQGTGLPVVGAGEVVLPGCTVEEAIESGRRAAVGEAAALFNRLGAAPAGAGIVCLCEDVRVEELESSCAQGFDTTELIKRYTNITKGPCQGVMCHAHLRAYAAAHATSPQPVRTAPTTARPPARPVRLQDVAAGSRYAIDYRTALHEVHVASGARIERVGPWLRPHSYGNLEQEYWAVRSRVSVMDVGTLGKFRVAGPDATEFLERLYPCAVADLKAGRSRYALLLNEAGFVIDDGLICSLGDDGYYLTFTSSGAEQAESWLRDWADTWQLDVYFVNVTHAIGAINVAGPHARAVLDKLAADAGALDAIPFRRHGEAVVAGVRCMVLRVGFVGEASYELHHPSTQSAALWQALIDAGREFEIRPHGLQTLRLLRLEKGHILVGQDTDFDTTPSKLGLDWAVKLEKKYFVGKAALERMHATPADTRLANLTFDGPAAPHEGTALRVNGEYVGYLTSSHYSPSLKCGVALGWLSTSVPESAVINADGIEGRITHTAFYDPEGVRQRG